MKQINGMRVRVTLFTTVLTFAVVFSTNAQETVFALLKKDSKRADEYFAERDFQTALDA
jgi:hypothetical protein